MPVARIADLAAVMIRALAPVYGHEPTRIATQVIGVKAGEKMYEELLSEEEVRRTLEMQDYFVVLPAFKNLYEQIEYAYPGVLPSQVSAPYNSARVAPLNSTELEAYLRASHLLGKH
jgi:FlaA1/EpsC-like NDP-sugar epimerase